MSNMSNVVPQRQESEESTIMLGDGMMDDEELLQQDSPQPSPEPQRRGAAFAGNDVTEHQETDSDSRTSPPLEADDDEEYNEEDYRVRFEDFEEDGDHEPKEAKVDMLYRVEERPPIFMAIVFGFQQVMLSINACVGLPLLISHLVCAGDLNIVKAELVSTFLVTSGISTILQTTLGLRLPILQGANFLILPAVKGILSVDHMKCPDFSVIGNQTDMSNMSNLTSDSFNVTSVNETVIDRTEIWQIRMREVQGAIIMASLVQMIIGASGCLNLLLRFIGPITVTPVIMLIGLALFQFGTDLMQKYWAIGFLTTILLVMFSTLMRDLKTPFVNWSRKKGFHLSWIKTFTLFPMILSILISWAVCGIMTAAGVITDDPKDPAYTARTDATIEGVQQAKWFFAPYPGQWGLPTVSFMGFLIMFVITIASMIESVGDYYACARVCGEVAPPHHAINRGLAMEGFVCMLGGLYGSGVMMTSYSNNIGAIAITKVGSRLTLQIGGLLFIFCGIIGKFGAVLAMVPEPVLGGLIFTNLAFITGAAMSNLTHIDLNSSRNTSILGFSVTLGLAIPTWLGHGNSFNTGNDQADLIVNAFFSNAVFIGGVVAAVLDNIVPGTLEERGMLSYRGDTSNARTEQYNDTGVHRLYDLPYIMPWIRKYRIFTYLPFMPTFDPELFTCFRRCRCKDSKPKKTTKRGQNGKNIGLQGGSGIANSCDVYKMQGRRLSVKPDEP